jgi:hypothetical protein
MNLKLLKIVILLFVLTSCSHPLPAKIGMNSAAINAISSGMSYEDVSAILGDPGKKQSETNVAGIPSANYLWMAPDGFTASGSFQGGKLVTIIKISEGDFSNKRLTQATALIDALRAGEEVYTSEQFLKNGADSYLSFGSISAKFPVGICSLPSDTKGIVNVPADLGQVAKILDVHPADFVKSEWKVAIEGDKENYRIAVEGIAPETANLAAYRDKKCAKTEIDTDPTL